MFKVTTGKEPQERTLCNSQNYRIVKRKVRKIIEQDPVAFFGTLVLYDNEKPIEHGVMIKKRLSWEKLNGE